MKVANSDDKSEYTTIKRTLDSILNNSENKEKIIDAITDRSIRATKICVLSSLLILYKINSESDNNNIRFFTTENIQSVVHDSFYSVLYEHNDLPHEFNNYIRYYRIQKPSNSFFGNIFKYLIEQYVINFENNIKIHAKTRLKKYFKISNIEATAQEIDHTISFMFNSFSVVEPRLDLINSIPNIQDLNTDFTRGFFSRLVHFNTFRAVFIFVKIQRAIHHHQQNEISVRNFTVVPMHSFKRKHIRLDTDAYYRLLQQIKLCPLVPSRSKKKTKPKVGMDFTRFMREKSKHWFSFFNKPKFKRMEKQQKKFHYQIVSDGVAASVLFENRNRKSTRAADTREIQRKYNEHVYENQCGIDLGYKLWVACVKKNPEDGKESNLKISSKQFHHATGKYKREKKAAKIVGQFEAEAAADRENRTLYPETPSPCNDNWRHYIIHRLKMFNTGIATYTDKRYK